MRNLIALLSLGFGIVFGLSAQAAECPKGNFEVALSDESPAAKHLQDCIHQMFGQAATENGMRIGKVVHEVKNDPPVCVLHYSVIGGVVGSYVTLDCVAESTLGSVLQGPDGEYMRTSDPIRPDSPDFKLALIAFDDLQRNPGEHRPATVDQLIEHVVASGTKGPAVMPKSGDIVAKSQ